MEANPEEGILEFLEQMDEADTTKFPIILNLLRILLNRDVLKENRLKSLEWTLNSIRSYIENFPFDEIYNEFDSTENDNQLCDTEQILEILSVLNHVLTFFEYFVEEAVENPVEAHELNILISSRLLQMFDILLPCINIDKSLILKLISNPMHLLQYVFFRAINVSDLKSKSSKSEIDECNDGFLNGCDVTNVAYNVNPFEDITVVSNLSYGIENEHEDIRLPMVYNPKHIMLSLIYVTIPFFEKKTNTATNNGLKFLKLLLDQLVHSLEKADLYFSSHKYILMHLNSIMVYSQVKENRNLALTCFKSYITCFNWEGRYLLLLRIRTLIDHSGTLGYLIVLIKELLSNFLELSKNLKLYHKYNNSKTDLVENADHIISSLNVLKFLILRDKDDVTDIKRFFTKINAEFLVPLKENIKNSKIYYEMKLKDLEGNDKRNESDLSKSDLDIELTVKNQTLPKLTKEQQKTAYMSCLNAKRRFRCCFFKIRNCSTKNDNQDKKENSSDDHQYESNIREKILNASLDFVPVHGWSREAISNGAESVGYPGIANGIFPNGGADVINYFYVKCNQKLKDYMIKATDNPQTIKEPQDFIRDSIEVRLRMLIPYIQKWPQAIAIMSLPPNVPVALANLLALSDDICFYAGDKSVDFNWYIRRIGVSGIYKVTELYMIQDKSTDFQETWKFLDRRLVEAIQIQHIISSGSEASTVAKDVVSAAFSTARNILHLNDPR
ncbi:conserved hypothetical protein [Pediculus humanus corporis]|uniref:Ubiquinone biosynthesis protein n=1 Tax=Pediculus humanus subsp. corporis TaxID=121224 RepID=E0VYX8_PEDHC|nr:uncharacterized protein Phum_PHUM521400 [Pediculus humanus corporis]EEB18584.1 conserved hypothetical protein [Pediculus humanus corporis]